MQEVVFSKHIIPSINSSLFLDSSKIEQIKNQKDFRLNLDRKLIFQYHLNEKRKNIYERSWSPSKAATLKAVTLNICTEYLQVLDKTSFGRQG